MLTDDQVKSAPVKKKSYKLSDKDNMYLLVAASGRKYWKVDYTFIDKRSTYPIGEYPYLSLDAARIECSLIKNGIRKGIDPQAKMRELRLEAARKRKYTFRYVGEEWYDKKISGKSKSHSSRTWRLLDKELFPWLGDYPITKIRPDIILEVLRGIEKRGVIDTAYRTRQTASNIFDYAMSCYYCDSNPAACLRHSLAPRDKKHYPTLLDPYEVGRLLLNLDCYSGGASVRYGLKLLSHIFIRPGELIQLRWDYVNWKECRLDIPARVMKGKRDHVVPLSRQCQGIVQEAYQLSGKDSAYLFPSPRGNSRHLSDVALRTALRSMGYDNTTIVPHGFRPMARTMIAEQLHVNPIFIELQLAHKLPDPNRGAYDRTRHISERIGMMQQWSDYLDSLKAQAQQPRPPKLVFSSDRQFGRFPDQEDITPGQFG
ncbi:Prophage integrase IntA [invertebrate metagenome]|uniref:Prophage integrase IntA n=1 Tax=invertebrate metagenome TaxID=1711999 RepID=A0A2H9TBP8_9ZZZZ